MTCSSEAPRGGCTEPKKPPRPPGSQIPRLCREPALPAPGSGGPRAPPSGPERGLQAGPPRLPARRTPTATQPVPLSGCTRPNPRTKTQNGCRQLRHVTPLCLSGPRTPRDPGTSGRGRRVALEGAPLGRGGRGSRPGEAG
ncbi:uncharacterized protein LOC144576902 isoform X1 [Callithrix jacchus]